MKRVILSFFLGICIFFCATFTVHAQESSTYSVDYNFHYSLNQSTDDVDVSLDITLTNLRSDVYITEYSIRFPKNINFKNLRVSDEGKQVPYVVTNHENTKQLVFKLGEPENGAQSQTILRLNYSLEGLHQKSSTMDEIILPLLVSPETGTIHATLDLPDNFNRTLSIAKPVPTLTEYKTIHWDPVTSKVIHVIFGDSQPYSIQLHYSLDNSSLFSRTQTIALPPETLFQKVTVASINPPPDRTFTDRDGNYLAEYNLGPRSSKEIDFKGNVEVFAKPQSTLRDTIRAKFSDQQAFLLTEKPLWSVGSSISTADLNAFTNARDIYQFVVQKLTYNPHLVQGNHSRLGASEALKNPSDAICTEFTDTFVALAREKGIPAREIEGFGFGVLDNLRPQSLAQDVLHAWPEFYNKQQETWAQVDPTWENTSGIDYFSGFDLNHIALAIHGQDPQLPLPAGFYKTENRRDVAIARVSQSVQDRVTLGLQKKLIPIMTAGKEYSGSITVTNTGNVFIHSLQIVPESQNIHFTPASLSVVYLAPFESREIPFTYTATQNNISTDTVTFTYDGAVLGSQDVRIAPQKSWDALIIGGSVIGIVLLSGLLVVIRSRNS